MSNRGLSRRTVLRGAIQGAPVSVALPVLNAMLDGNGSAFAGGEPLPLRFGTWMWGAGVRPDRWIPKQVGVGNVWQLSDELAPLTSVKDRISVITGMSVPGDGKGGHAEGAQYILTGALPQYAARPLPDGQTPTTASRPSIDVLVKRAWQGKAKSFDALYLTISQAHSDEGTSPNYISHNGPDSFNAGEMSPRRLFDRVFAGTPAGGTTPTPDLGRVAAVRRSVLDGVIADARRLGLRLGAEDRARLEIHLESIRGIENRLPRPGTPLPAGPTCARPSAPADITSGPLRPRNQMMAEILSVALACDLTRVFAYQYSTWLSTLLVDIGQSEEYHELTHNDPQPQPKVHAGATFFMSELAVLLEKLQSLGEGAGTILDNCAILCVSDMGDGSVHTPLDVPIIVAGRAGGAIRSGQHWRGGVQDATQDNTSRVHLAIMKALGLSTTEFGAGAGRTTQPLSALLS